MQGSDRKSEETIDAFAIQYRLSPCRDTDGTTIIQGRAGCHLYEYGDGELGLAVNSDRQKPRPRRWAEMRKKCIAAGMTLRQKGDDEGALSFNPNNREQARLAIKLAGVRPKRQLSPEHRAKLVSVGFQKRRHPTLGL